MDLGTARELAQEKVAHLKRVDRLLEQEIEPGEVRSCSEIFVSLGQRIESLLGYTKSTGETGRAWVLFERKSPDEPPVIGLCLENQYVIAGGTSRLNRISARWDMRETVNVFYSDTGDDQLVLEDVWESQTREDNDSARQRLYLIAQSVTEAERAKAL